MPQIENLSAKLAIPPKFKLYQPDLANKLSSFFEDSLVRVESTAFGNEMPLQLVGEADRVLMISTLNGDNFEATYKEISFVGNALTYDEDAAGPNTHELGIFFPFIDLRQSERSRKPASDGVDKAIVKAQGVTNEVIATSIKYTAGAKYVVFTDMHNPFKSAKNFTKHDLGVINLSTNEPFAENLVNNGYLDDSLESVVVATDMGILLSAYDLAGKLGTKLNREKSLPMAIFNKTKIGSDVNQELLYGQIEGKRVIVIDDMVGSATTIDETIAEILKYNPAEIIVYIPHPVFAPKEYYERISRILENEKVKLFMVANTLPFERGGKTYAKPYARINGQKEVQVLDVHDWIIQKIQTILNAKDYQDAKEKLAGEIVEPRNPLELLYELTGIRLTTEKDVAIYREGQQIVPLLKTAEVFIG